MSQYRKAAPFVPNQFKIDVGQHQLGYRFGLLSDNLAPWINNQAVAEGLSTTRMTPRLRRRDDPGEILNRPATQQNMPVRLSGWYSECGRNGKHFSTTLTQRSKEFWETHVVTDRQPHLGVVQGNEHWLGPRGSSS